MLVVLLFSMFVVIFTFQPLEGVLLKLVMQLDENVLMQVNSLHSNLITENQSLPWKVKAGLLSWCRHPF